MAKYARGSILIITLWVLSLLTIFAVAIGFNVAQQLRFADHLQERVKMYYLAQGGIDLSIAQLEKDETKDFDALKELGADDEEAFKNRELGDGYLTVNYQTKEYSIAEDAKAIIMYGLVDESSKININKAPVQVLKSLLEKIGGVEAEEAANISNSILDWRDTDIILSPGGAEDAYYKQLELAYDCKNADFQAPEELLLVKGMTPEIFSKIKDVITIFGNADGKININTVGFSTLIGLGLSEDAAKLIIEHRNGPDEKLGTDDDLIFQSPADLATILTFLPSEEPEALNYLINNIFTVKSNCVRINSIGHLKKDIPSEGRVIECVALRQGTDNKAQIVYWRED